MHLQDYKVVLYESRRFESSFFVSCITVRCGPRLPAQSSSLLWSFQSLATVRELLTPFYLRILFNLISPSFLPSFSFPLSPIRVVTIFSGILQIFILYIRLYHPNLSDFINFTMLAPRNLSLTPYLFLLSSFLCVTINCSYTHPFEYS